MTKGVKKVGLLEELVLNLVLLHGPAGQEIHVNPSEVVELRVPRTEDKHWPKDVHCIINTSDGKFTSVVETCTKVYEMLREK
jgi:hypothetical protein